MKRIIPNLSIFIIGTTLIHISNGMISKLSPIYRRELLPTRRGGSSALNRHYLRDKNRQTFYYLKNFESEDDDENNSDDDDDEYDDEEDEMERELKEIMKPKVQVKKSSGGSKYREREEAALEAGAYEFKRDNKRSTPLKKLHGRFDERRKIMKDYFLNTTSFVHGDTFLGLGRTTSGILFGYFATMYFVYVLSTTLLLFQRRKDPSLSKFPLWISHFSPAVMNSVIVVLGFVQHMFRAKYPCFLVLWTHGLLIPMYVVLIFEARSLNLIFEYHWNKRMQILLQASEPRSAIDESNPIIVLDRPSTRKPDSSSSTSNEDWLWIKKNGMISTVLVIFIFQFLLTVSIQIFSPYYKIWPKMMVYRCAGALEMILLLLAFLMYTFVLPLYLFIQLKRINDSYGVRKDIYSAVTQSAWIFLLFSLLRHVFFIEKFIGYCPTGFAIMISFGILHYHTVCAPLLRIYVWQWSRSRGVKKRMKKLILLKRKIESYIFPRIFRIKLDKKKYGGSGSFSGKGNLKAPEPLKANRSGELRQRSRGSKYSNPVEISNTCSPTDSRLDETASPAASMSPIVPPDLKPPTFNQVLQDETLCELFERYTLLEFSRENLLFYRAVCSLRSTYAALPNGAAQIFLVEKSRSLSSQFIHINSPAEINIPGPVRKRIESRLSELDVDLTLFDEAQREVFRLMQNWSYPRFLRTLPDAEIRRFNRKARRNSTTAHLDQNGASFSSNPAANDSNSQTSAAVPISTNQNTSLQVQRSRALHPQDQHELLATSVCSLTLPMNIANVSLSSSP